MFLAPQALDWEDGSDAIMLANVLRTYMVAVELGARRQGDVNCMAFAAMRLDTTIHFAFLIAMLCPTGAPPQTTGERMMLLYLLNSLIFLIADWGRPFLNKDGETFAASIDSALPFLVVATTARAARLQRCLKVFSNMKMETLPPKLEERGPFLLESAYGVLFLTQTVRFFSSFLFVDHHVTACLRTSRPSSGGAASARERAGVGNEDTVFGGRWTPSSGMVRDCCEHRWGSKRARLRPSRAIPNDNIKHRVGPLRQNRG